MRIVTRATQFRKDYKLIIKRGKIVDKLDAVISMLATSGSLPPKYKLHKLTGNWVDHLECHLEPDWLLIFQIDEDEVYLVRTGTHSDLFG